MMRTAILGLLVLAVAAPSEARRARPMLPVAPPGMDYVESVCTGGIDGRLDQVRVLASGAVLKMTRRSNGVWRTSATRGEVLRLWRALDRADFQRRVVPAEKPYMMDGISCSLAQRKNGRYHSVSLMQQQYDKPRYRDLKLILDTVTNLGDRAAGPIAAPLER